MQVVKISLSSSTNGYLTLGEEQIIPVNEYEVHNNTISKKPTPKLTNAHLVKRLELESTSNVHIDTGYDNGRLWLTLEKILPNPPYLEVTTVRTYTSPEQDTVLKSLNVAIIQANEYQGRRYSVTWLHPWSHSTL